MRSMPCDLTVSAARADALFASVLQRSDEPSARQVEQAVTAAIGAFGERGCAARVAQAYGEHPETAVARMRWARTMVADAFGAPPSGDDGYTTPRALAWKDRRGGLNPLALAS